MKPYSLWKKIGFKSGFKFNHVTLKCQMNFLDKTCKVKSKREKVNHWILHIQKSLGSKFQLKTKWFRIKKKWISS